MYEIVRDKWKKWATRKGEKRRRAQKRRNITAIRFFVYKSGSRENRVLTRVTDKQTHLLVDDGRIAERPQGRCNLTSEIRQNHVWTVFLRSTAEKLCISISG